MNSQYHFISEKGDLLDTKKLIALTFDDGPNTAATNDILDIIEEYGVTASFFVVGKKITAKTSPVILRAHTLGCEINSHGFTHSYMDKMSEEEIKNELKRTSECIFRITGGYPRFFRPPYIAVSETLFDSVSLPFICGIGCDDWDNKVSEEARFTFLTNECKDGMIVLLHDQTKNVKTVNAVRRALPRLLDEGFGFVTVSELFKAKGITPRPHILYSFATETGQA